MRVTLRLPDELHHRLQMKARQAGVSVNQSIVTALNESVLSGDDGGNADDEHAALLDQVRHIRTALGDLIVELDPEDFPAHVRPTATPIDREGFKGFMRSLPKLDPPLSATIIADREDRF